MNNNKHSKNTVKPAKTGPMKAVFNKQSVCNKTKPVPGNIKLYFAQKRLLDNTDDCLFVGPVVGLPDVDIGRGGLGNNANTKILKLDKNAESESPGIEPKLGGQVD